MRITFNPAVMNAAPVGPVRRIRPVTAQSLPPAEEPDDAPAEAVTVGLSLRGLVTGDEEPSPRDERRRKPLWTTMVNLSRLKPAEDAD